MGNPANPTKVSLGDYIEVHGQAFRLCSLTMSYTRPPELEFKHIVFEMQEPQFNVRPVSCMEHILVQHRDAKPPWCDSCGRGATNAKLGIPNKQTED